MASKRIALSPKRASKRSRTAKLIPTVVDALADAEALPSDLRTLLKLSLPVVLDANKADREAYEVEVVDQAQQALATVLAALQAQHKTALGEQNKVIDPREHKGRTNKKQEAEAALERAKAKHESCKEARNAAQKAVHDAQNAVKVAEKEGVVADKEVQHHVDQKTTLTDLLANEFVLLKDQTSHAPGGKKAENKVLALAKEYKVDSTLLQTFPMTCKKPAANRSEFENMMFTSLQAGFDKSVKALTQKIAECEPVRAQKNAATAAAKAALERAEAALTKAVDDLGAAATAQKEAGKEVTKADTHLYEIWNDMKKVCDAQDQLLGEVKNFNENVLTAFQQLKNKEPEPEPVEEPEPVPEEAPPAEAVAEGVAA